MDINWSTFFLEALNFVILVWILQRFLYRPVLAAVSRRREEMQAERAEIATLREEAERMRDDYAARLEAWEREQTLQRDQLLEQIELERSRLLEELQAELTREREKAEAVEKHRAAEVQHHVEREAVELAGQFASRLLRGLAGPEVNERLATLLTDELQHLSPAQKEPIRAMFAEEMALDGGVHLRVRSALPLREETRERLTQTLQSDVGRAVPIDFEEDPALIAGLEVNLGFRVLHANLRDELRYFTEASIDGR